MFILYVVLTITTGLHYFFMQSCFGTMCTMKSATQVTLTWLDKELQECMRKRETAWEVTACLRTQQGPHAELIKRQPEVLWHFSGITCRCTNMTTFDFGKFEGEKRGGDDVFPNFLSYTTLRLMCVCLQNMMYLEVNFLLPNQNTQAHIKLSEKQLIKTSYGSTTLSNVPFSKQSKMLPGKIPTFKLNNNESRLLCQDKNRNICARRCNLLIYSQLRDNILMNKTKFSSRITRENQAHMCHSRVPGAGGLSPTPVSTQTLGKKANVVHRKTGKESQKIKYLEELEKTPNAVCHLTKSINPGDWL